MPPAVLDWAQCPAVESVPGRLNGAWVLRETRMPVSVIFESLEYGSSIEQIIENYDVTRAQIRAVLDFAARSAALPMTPPGPAPKTDPRILSERRSCRRNRRTRNE